MFKRINLKILNRVIPLALCFSFVISLCSFEAKCVGIRDSVLRLHILANSDCEVDQNLKLKVRDSLLESAGELFDTLTDKESAKIKAQNSLPELEKIATQTLIQNGCDYTVTVKLSKAYFDTRVYGENTFPAGIYDALIVNIGEGKGKNWWCVMFPPLCISAASEEVEVKDVLSSEEQEIVGGGQKYKVKFWCVEKYYELRQKLSEIF